MAQRRAERRQRRFSWDGYSSDSSAATTVRTTTTPDSIYDGHSDAASSWEDPSRAASHAEPSVVATARAVATARLSPSSEVDELLANFVGEDADEIYKRRGW